MFDRRRLGHELDFAGHKNVGVDQVTGNIFQRRDDLRRRRALRNGDALVEFGWLQRQVGFLFDDEFGMLYVARHYHARGNRLQRQ